MLSPGLTSSAIRLHRCPRCDYDITALPRRHRCPECGFEYDESMFVLEGWRLPGPRNAIRTFLKYGGGLLLLVVLLRSMVGMTWLVIAWIIAALVVVIVALYVYVSVRDQSGSRALARYLVTGDGVARVGRRGGRIYLWRNYSHVALLPEADGGFRLHLYPSWWHFLGPPLVNARLECDEAEAREMRGTIEYRMLRAKADED